LAYFYRFTEPFAGYRGGVLQIDINRRAETAAASLDREAAMINFFSPQSDVVSQLIDIIDI
jgi:hypothetical protein